MNEILSLTNKFMLVLIRTSGVVMLAPMFGGAVVPMRIRAAFVLIVSLVLTPVVGSAAPRADGFLAYGVLAVHELAVGLMLGFAAVLAFGSFQIAGEFVGRQMGFAMGRLADPLHGESTSVLNQFHYMFAMLIFLAINGHHWFLQALTSSFNSIPLGASAFSAAITGGMVERFVEVFAAGLKVAAPAVCVLVLVTIGLGMLARAAPLLNMLMISISVRIVVGLVLVGSLMPYTYSFGKLLLLNMRVDLARLIEAL